jgi:hypothetical protein
MTVTGKHEPNVVLKDNDLKHKLRIPKEFSLQLLQQLRLDADLLCHKINVMDYSLLGIEVFNEVIEFLKLFLFPVGVHNTQYKVDDTSSTAYRSSSGDVGGFSQGYPLSRFPVLLFLMPSVLLSIVIVL